MNSGRHWNRLVPLAGVALFLSALGLPRPAAAGLGGLRVDLSLGASQMGLGDVKDVYQAVLQVYRDQGLSLETQREFPGNLVLGADVLGEVADGLFVGGGARYTWTHAYTLYGDPTGTLDVNGSVTLLTLETVLQRVWQHEGGWSPFVEVRGGFGLGRLTVEERVELTGSVTGRSETTLEASSVAPALEVHLGTRRPFLGLVTLGAIGYRYCNISSPEGDLTVNGQPAGSGELGFDVDLSGIVAELRFEIRR